MDIATEHLRVEVGYDPDLGRVERLLAQFYVESTARRTESVTFSCVDLDGPGLMEQSLLASWALQLNALGKTVSILLARELQPSSFLFRYGLHTFLRSAGVLVSPCPPDPYASFGAQFLPFHGLLDSSYIEHLNSLEGLAADDTQEPDRPRLDIHGIRDVVLHELRDNILTHGNSRLPYFATTKYPLADPTKRRALLSARAASGPPWERPFYEELIKAGADGLLEIVLGDSGPGIPKTMRRNPEFQGLSESVALSRAFDFDSTGDPEGRLARLAAYLVGSSDGREGLPGTGLYWVKEYLKGCRGLLSVRCGKSYHVLDFLRFPGDGQPLGAPLSRPSGRHKIRVWPSRLASFAGTHFKLLVPLWRESTVRILPRPEVRAGDLDVPPRIAVVPAGTMMSSSGVDSPPAVLRVLEELHVKQRQLLEEKSLPLRRGVILLDFAGLSPQAAVSKNAWHLLLNESARSQSTAIAVIAANVPAALMGTFELAVAVASPRAKGQRVLTAVSANCRVRFLGGGQAMEDALAEVLLRPPEKWAQGPHPDHPDFSHQTHLLAIRDDEYLSSLSLGAALSQLREAAADELARWVLDARNGVFDPSARVSVHGRYYVAGFFEVHRLFRAPQARETLRRWLALSALLSHADTVVAVGSCIGPAFSAEEVGVDRWVGVPDPATGASIGAARDLGGARALVVTDVLGTARTLTGLLEGLPLQAPLGVLTVIDARAKTGLALEMNVDGKTISVGVRSVVRRRLEYYFDKPPAWTYESIRELDRSNNTLLVRPQLALDSALWLPMRCDQVLDGEDRVESYFNPLFDELIPSSQAVHVGHYQGPSLRHMAYFFDVESILEQNLATLCTLILTEASRAGIPSAVSHVIFPDYNPGLASLALAVAKGLGGAATPHPIPFDAIHSVDLERDWAREFPNPATFIAIDDSIVSGFTQRRLVDIAQRSGASALLSFGVLNRADVFTSRFLSTVCGYGAKEAAMAVRIRHLCDASVGTFDRVSCPVCAYQEELRSLAREVRGHSGLPASCAEFLENEEQQFRLLEHPPSRRPEPEKKGGRIAADCATMARLRWLFELSVPHIGARNQVRREVRTATADPRLGAALADVLYLEWPRFFGSEAKMYEKVFYPSLRRDASAALLHLAADRDYRAGREAGILLSWLALDESGFYAQFPPLLQPLALEDGGSFWAFVWSLIPAHQMLGFEPGVRLVDMVLQLRQALAAQLSYDGQASLEALCAFLQGRFEKRALPQVYASYLDAICGPYYFNEQAKLMAELAEQTDEAELLRVFEETVVASRRNVGGIHRLLDSDLLGAIDKQILARVLRSLEGIAHVLDSRTARPLPVAEALPLVKDFARELNLSQSTVAGLAANVSEAVSRAKSDGLVSAIFEKFGVATDLDGLDSGEFVFLRQGVLEWILKELLRNVAHAFSGASQAERRLMARTRVIGRFLAIELYDNGTSRGQARPERGIHQGRRFCESVGGQLLPPTRISASDPLWLEGYRSRVAVHLVRIPRASEVFR